MSRRRNAPLRNTPPRPAARPEPRPALAQNRAPWIAGIGTGLVALAAIGLIVYYQFFAPTQSPFKVGWVNECIRQPIFIRSLGLGERPMIGTAVKGVTGFAVIEPNTGQIYQDSTWDDAGNLGAYAYDRDGVVYLGPAPLTSLQLNPPEKQNILQRIDTRTGKMAPWLELPAALPPSGNPFGILGMAYDCDTNSLYVTSVAGSSPVDEVGRIFRIDLVSGTIASRYEGVDAFGIHVFNTPAGKRLYFGKARSPELHSIALDTKGGFVGTPRLEFNTTGFQQGDDRKIRRITFTNANQMTLKARDFNFYLEVSSERQETTYAFHYDPQNNSWVLDGITRE